MDGINRTNVYVMFMGQLWDNYGSANKRSLSKVMHILYFISAFCVAPATLAPMFTAGEDGCRLSDNSFICFHRKAFLKSDMLARFTTNVAIIEYLTCVI